jgi:hypothetical protein
MQNIIHKYQYYPIGVNAFNSILTASVPALMMAGGGNNKFTIPQLCSCIKVSIVCFNKGMSSVCF